MPQLKWTRFRQELMNTALCVLFYCLNAFNDSQISTLLVKINKAIKTIIFLHKTDTI